MFSTIGYAICIPFAALLRLFYNLTGSYGVSLILFTLVIKLILLPFQMKSKKSMVRMSRMSGKMQEIQKKYANNQLKMQEEMQKFYQEEGFNPMSGCLWSFLPLPILMALYYIIREPIVYFMNFGGKDAGLAVVNAARSLIEGAGIEIVASPGYEQIAISNIINSQFPDFIAEHPGWVNIDYHFLGIDLIQTPWSAVRHNNGKLEITMKILVSACLLGENCKYNGKNNYSERVAKYLEGHEVIPVCPEVLGGLPTPRDPSEIVSGEVINCKGVNVDRQFREGAEEALRIAKENGIDLAILQSRSPSCGVKQIYDGNFTGKLIPGQGVFAQLLEKNGFRVMDCEEI